MSHLEEMLQSHFNSETIKLACICKSTYLNLKMHPLNIQHFSITFLFLLSSTNTYKVQGRDPKGTPLDELLRKRNTVCQAVSREEIDQARSGWSACIDNFILRPNHDLEEFEDLRQYYKFFCRDTDGFKACWTNVTALLNACENNRGNVAQKLYFTIYDLTCTNNGSDTASNIIKSVEIDDLCDLNYLTKTCNETKSDWYSIDICRRYEAQKICEEKAISSCTNAVHKQVLLGNLDKIGQSLGCFSAAAGSSITLHFHTSFAILCSILYHWLKLFNY